MSYPEIAWYSESNPGATGTTGRRRPGSASRIPMARNLRRLEVLRGRMDCRWTVTSNNDSRNSFHAPDRRPNHLPKKRTRIGSFFVAGTYLFLFAMVSNRFLMPFVVERTFRAVRLTTRTSCRGPGLSCRGADLSCRGAGCDLYRDDVHHHHHHHLHRICPCARSQ